MGWPLPLLWPFSTREWALPLIPWGDPLLTLIFLAEMFALYRWPSRTRLVSCTTLLALGGYLGLRAALA
jgi:hypothetical protein